MPFVDFTQRPFSASSLRLYQQCPRRFRLRYIDGLRLSTLTEADRLALKRGEHFHLMARRLYSGLDPARLADPVEQSQLDHWLGLLQSFLPRSFDRAFYPELELRLNGPDLRLMATFDLLVVDPDGQAIIFDWKTEQRPPGRHAWARSMQTLVYRYMLCAAGGAYSPLGSFAPDQVSMVYWNPSYPERWERLPYSEAQYQADDLLLRRQVAAIRATGPDGFTPTEDPSVCRRCEYRSLCHGGAKDGVDAADAGHTDEEEVPLPPEPSDLADWPPEGPLPSDPF